MIILLILLIILLLLLFLVLWGINDVRVGIASNLQKETINYIPQGQMLPQKLVADTMATAKALFGNNQAKQEDFATSAIGMVCACQDKDILLLFNSGGFGYAHINDAAGWSDITQAMKEILRKRGYNTFIISYNRAVSTIYGLANELGACLNQNKKQISEEAAKLYLCLAHNPQLKIILCGESNGGYASYQVLKLLNNSERVFAVITGPPPWNGKIEHPQAYITRTNGVEPDSFSYFKIGTMLKENTMVILRRKKKVEGGKILNSIGSPGHVYNWKSYPVLQEEIYKFLCKYFKKRNFKDPLL